MDSKPTVLVVDDAASNVQVLAQILKEDYRVKVANSGARALDLAKNLPDLILLDIIMPDMDGYEVCERLKANEETRHIPIIFITARSDAEDEERGLALGAVDYIAKPINSAIVRARVKTHITLQKQYSQLQFLAMHDQLTGLYNRHYLLDYAVKKIANAKRHSLPMSVAMIDIDHFKNLNDSYGHNVGDEVLHATAQVLLRSCRTEDIAARVGGEEFVLLLDHCNITEAESLLERIRFQIEQLQPRNIKITASFGVTELHADDSELEQLLDRADQALYQAKNCGRNNIKIAA